MLRTRLAGVTAPADSPLKRTVWIYAASLASVAWHVPPAQAESRRGRGSKFSGPHSRIAFDNSPHGSDAMAVNVGDLLRSRPALQLKRCS